MTEVRHSRNAGGLANCGAKDGQTVQLPAAITCLDCIRLIGEAFLRPEHRALLAGAGRGPRRIPSETIAPKPETSGAELHPLGRQISPRAEAIVMGSPEYRQLRAYGAHEARGFRIAEILHRLALHGLIVQGNPTEANAQLLKDCGRRLREAAELLAFLSRDLVHVAGVCTEALDKTHQYLGDEGLLDQARLSEMARRGRVASAALDGAEPPITS